jgi:hypothetical protein
VTKLAVVPNKFVNVESEYQLITLPAIVPAVNITIPVPQRLLGVVEIIVANGFMVANTAVLVPLKHPVNVSLVAA